MINILENLCMNRNNQTFGTKRRIYQKFLLSIAFVTILQLILENLYKNKNESNHEKMCIDQQSN